METKRITSALVIAAILALTAQSALAGISISACFGTSRHSYSSFGHGRIAHGPIGHHIGRPYGCSPHISSRVYHYPYRSTSIVYHSPHYSRFSSICAPRHNIVVTVPPVVHRPAPVQVVESSTITVWFTNTNGSKSSVTLTKSGPGFIGPRSEYYKSMPTDEQLRMVYGF